MIVQGISYHQYMAWMEGRIVTLGPRSALVRINIGVAVHKTETDRKTERHRMKKTFGQTDMCVCLYMYVYYVYIDTYILIDYGSLVHFRKKYCTSIGNIYKC